MTFDEQQSTILRSAGWTETDGLWADPIDGTLQTRNQAYTLHSERQLTAARLGVGLPRPETDSGEAKAMLEVMTRIAEALESIANSVGNIGDRGTA